jgi:hypothetical protein
MVKEKKQAQYIYGIIFVVALIGAFLITFLIFRNVGTLNYEGLTFTKERIGQITVYHYYYLYEDKRGQLVQNNIYLRNNPKDNDVPVYGDNITYLSNKFTFLSINASSLENCSQSSIAIAELAAFLANGGINVRGATLENNSISNSTLYATCKGYPVNPVIQLNRGNTTEINSKLLCYDIRFARCEDVLPAVEKFIIQSIIDAKETDAAK